MIELHFFSLIFFPHELKQSNVVYSSSFTLFCVIDVDLRFSGWGWAELVSEFGWFVLYSNNFVGIFYGSLV